MCRGLIWIYAGRGTRLKTSFTTIHPAAPTFPCIPFVVDCIGISRADPGRIAPIIGSVLFLNRMSAADVDMGRLVGGEVCAYLRIFSPAEGYTCWCRVASISAFGGDGSTGMGGRGETAASPLPPPTATGFKTSATAAAALSIGSTDWCMDIGWLWTCCPRSCILASCKEGAVTFGLLSESRNG